MTEQVIDPQINTDGTGTGTQPNGDGTQHGGEPTSGGGTSTPQKTEGALAGGRVVPDGYNLTAPAGSGMASEYIESVANFAKENKLTNDEAQAVLNRDHNLRASMINSQREELDTRAEEWAESAKTDGEIGGDNFNGNIELAKRVVQKFATPAFMDSLNETGLGNHPEVIRVFSRIGKHLKDDSFVFSKSEGAPTQRSAEDVFYGDSKNK